MVRILIADDEPSILDSLSLALRDEGHEVMVINEGKVMGLIRTFKPDIILLDIWAGHFDGGKLCRKIKSDPNLTNIKVVLMSANKNIQKIAIKSGADDYIAKPMDICELLKIVVK